MTTTNVLGPKLYLSSQHALPFTFLLTFFKMLDLSMEVLDEVFDYVANGNRNVKSFSTLCHVNWQWYEIAIPRLYSRWTYNGEKHSFLSL